MRTIEKQMWQAIECQDRQWSTGNTAVEYRFNDDVSRVYLHGHHIADYDHGTESVSPNLKTLRAWPTNVTRSRLRALGINARIKQGQPTINGELI